MSGEAVTIRRVVRTWWPLAASWLLMAAEGPALNAIVARLPDATINLAAFGIVFSLSLIVEAPIIMLLSASTALSKDWDSYRKLRRFMMSAGAALTALHALVAFTPLYHLVVVRLMGVPPQLVAPARLGLMIMLPWTWSIAYRRFHQGVLIRFGHSQAVSIGTAIRLSADAVVLGSGYLIGSIPGIVVATAALATGVIGEATYAGLRTRPVLRQQVRQARSQDAPLTVRSFLAFYIPLAMTSLLFLIVQPLGSAALSRMPQPVESLAAWSVVTNFVFLLRAPGIAYNEVVIALLDEPRAVHALRRFDAFLVILTTVLMVLVTATPLSTFWFARVVAVPPELIDMARRGLWPALPLPGLSALSSWYQGLIVHSRRTRGITESTVVFLVVCTAILGGGVLWGRTIGLYVGLIAFSAGLLAQTAWLWVRSRAAVQFARAQLVERA